MDLHGVGISVQLAHSQPQWHQPTDWIKLDKQAYDLCLDRKDYRSPLQ
jgi:hypothetical protein